MSPIRFSGRCATTADPPPIDDASSIECEYVYVAPSASPCCSRFRNRTASALKLDCAEETS